MTPISRYQRFWLFVADPQRVELLGRINIGLAGASGLMIAACLSGLPSVTCTALAQTYVTEIGDLSAVVLYGMIGFILSRGRVINNNVSTLLKVKIIFAYAFVVAVAIIFWIASTTGGTNLGKSFRHCFIGTEDELKARIHQAINIKDAFGFDFSKTWGEQ